MTTCPKCGRGGEEPCRRRFLGGDRPTWHNARVLAEITALLAAD